MIDNRIAIRNPHNHEANVIDLNESFLRNAMRECGISLQTQQHPGEQSTTTKFTSKFIFISRTKI